MAKLAAVTALTLYLTVGLARAGAVPPRFFGTITINDATKSELARMDRGDVGILRTNFYWPAVEPFAPGVRDWSRYDRLVGTGAARGIRVLPTIYGTPGWAGPTGNGPPDAEYRDEFEAFVRAAVKRYGPGGQYWTDPTLYRLDHPGAASIPIIDWQMWNEPNSPVFWGYCPICGPGSGRPSGQSYVELLKAGARGVRSASRKARVVTAGLVKDPGPLGIPMMRYLHQIYRAGGRGSFDAISIHPYTHTPRQTMRTVEDARRFLNRHHSGRVKIWITEVGWPTSGDWTTLTIKPKVQAKYLGQVFRLAARKRKRYRIGGVIWFCFRDEASRYWLNRTGLFETDGGAKPAWKSFVRFTGGLP